MHDVMAAALWAQATRVSAMMFHSKPLPQFGYADFSSKQPLLNAIGAFVYPYVPAAPLPTHMRKLAQKIYLPPPLSTCKTA